MSIDICPVEPDSPFIVDVYSDMRYVDKTDMLAYNPRPRVEGFVHNVNEFLRTCIFCDFVLKEGQAPLAIYGVHDAELLSISDSDSSGVLLWFTATNACRAREYKIISEYAIEIMNLMGRTFICSMLKRNRKGVKWLESMGFQPIYEERDSKFLRMERKWVQNCLQQPSRRQSFQATLSDRSAVLKNVLKGQHKLK